jgi:transcriptional regulator with XRE-family HTH domain
MCSSTLSGQHTFYRMTDLISTGRRRELGAELRRLRERMGINGQEMAARLEWTTTSISRAETGKRAVSQFEVLKYTTVCGADAMTQAALMDLAVEPDDYRIMRHDGWLPDALKALMFHESTAIAIDTYEPIYIPGTMQTEDYIRVVHGGRQGRSGGHGRTRRGPAEPAQGAHQGESGAVRVLRARERTAYAGGRSTRDA